MPFTYQRKLTVVVALPTTTNAEPDIVTGTVVIHADHILGDEEITRVVCDTTQDVQEDKLPHTFEAFVQALDAVANMPKHQWSIEIVQPALTIMTAGNGDNMVTVHHTLGTTQIDPAYTDKCYGRYL